MIIYRFRVLYDDPEDRKIYRDIEVKAVNTFYDFHKIIQKEFSFNGTELASFYICDNKWNKKQEITLIEMDDEKDEPQYIMKETKISAFINKKNRKLIYVYDFMEYHTFFIDLTDIISKQEKKSTYPRCVKRIGNRFPSKYRKKDDDEDIDVKPFVQRHHAKKPELKKSKNLDYEDVREFDNIEGNLDVFDELKDYEDSSFDFDDNIDDFERF